MISEELFKHVNDESSVFQRFLMFFVIGFFIICVGVIILMVAVVLSNGSTGFGVRIFIGPFPMVIGAGLQVTWIVLFVLVLAILSIVMFRILHRENKEANTLVLACLLLFSIKHIQKY